MDLWKLFNFAEPIMFFNYTGDFNDLISLLDNIFNRSKPSNKWWNKNNSIEYSLYNSFLFKYNLPVFTNLLGKIMIYQKNESK